MRISKTGAILLLAAAVSVAAFAQTNFGPTAAGSGVDIWGRGITADIRMPPMARPLVRLSITADFP